MAAEFRARLRQYNLGFVLVAIFSLSGCGGGGESTDAPSSPVSNNVEALSIAEQVYDASQRTPAGFLDDPTQYPGLSEFRFHVAARDVGLAGVADLSFEVCSNDFATALGWSDQASNARALPSTASGNSETDWYFQVDRVLDSDPSSMVVTRVFKCDALDRSTRDTDGSAGVVLRQPASGDDLRFLSEYFWRFSIYNNALNAVVSSTGATNPGVLTHDLVRAEAIVGAGVDNCDRIDLYRWRHSLDLGSGELSESTIWLQSFDARFANGQVSLCED
ncbi:MAG: hypothetical protein AAGL69_10660 [Pseudomonadota bacterium]